MAGTLYLVSTPIGNMGDMTERGWKTLEEADFIAAEDTRVTLKLLSKRGISKPLVSYFEHNRRERGEYILSRLLAGESCALTTDAGTPAISDPGEDLVALCHANGVAVVPVPGACAGIAALSASGMASGRFCFEGFLSTTRRSRSEHLASVSRERRTMIFYEAPHKLRATLADMLESFGDRQLCIAREITKIHEEIKRTTLSEAVSYYAENEPRGEYVLIVGGFDGEDEAPVYGDTPQEAVQALIEQGVPRTEAVRRISKERGVPRSELYRDTL